MLDMLGNRATGVVCFDSPDLTTNNTKISITGTSPTGPTTLPDNSLPNWPPSAFTPMTDRAVLAPASNPTTITRAVPGIQVEGYFADDPTHEARFLLRFPTGWNGKLVIAGASGTRSEFNGDFAWSDYVLQKGYAYASQNKGVMNLRLSTASDPLACRLNPSSEVFVHFYDNDPEKPFTQWTHYMIETGKLAQEAVLRYYGSPAKHTFAVGTSNGGYQVRRALEEAPELFDGGIDWEGTFVDPHGSNLLTDLPVLLANFPAYVSAGFDPNSRAAKNIVAAGFPPDITALSASGTTISFWDLHNTVFWEVTMSQWQKRLDPAYQTYVSGLANYDYSQRVLATQGKLSEKLEEIATTGNITKPLITVAGTMDALLPIRYARQYEARVLAHEHHAAYRLYEVQNGNHIDSYAAIFPQLEVIQPHAHAAFDFLVNHVENDAPLPPSQCIPRGGNISATPTQIGHCANLLEI